MVQKTLGIAAALLLVCSGVAHAQNTKGDASPGTGPGMSPDSSASSASRSGKQRAAKRGTGTKTTGESNGSATADTNMPATSTDPAQIKHARDGSLMNSSKSTAPHGQATSASGTGK